MPESIEIRMFGRLHVRRSDGSVVDPREWKTGKATDLLRLLALSAGQSLRADGLIEKLWPDVSDVSGHQSLRTAASMIRKTLGTNCIRNHLGMLTLVGTWVDTDEFRALAAQGLSAARSGDDTAVIDATRHAESLYVDDFRAHADDSHWSSQTRRELSLLRLGLLAEAAESSMRLWLTRDAIEFSSLAVAADASFERPHRSLMRAHASMGQTDRALRAFDHCRQSLAQELGANPSEQTRVLHDSILAGTANNPPTSPFFEWTGPIHALSAALDELRHSTRIGVICVAGEPGSGRRSLIEAALATEDHPDADVDVWGPFDGEPLTWAPKLARRIATRVRPPTNTLIIVTSTLVSAHIAHVGAQGANWIVRVVECHRLQPTELTDLAATILQGRATVALTDELSRQSGQLAGRATKTLRGWLTDGRIMATDDGIDLWDDDGADELMLPVGARFRLLLEQLEADELNLCELLSVAERPMSAADVVAVSPPDSPAAGVSRGVGTTLDRLVDRGLIREDPADHTYSFRELRMRSSFSSWLRPAARAKCVRAWDGMITADSALDLAARPRGSGGSNDRRHPPGGRRAADRPS